MTRSAISAAALSGAHISSFTIWTVTGAICCAGFTRQECPEFGEPFLASHRARCERHGLAPRNCAPRPAQREAKRRLQEQDGVAAQVGATSLLAAPWQRARGCAASGTSVDRRAVDFNLTRTHPFDSRPRLRGRGGSTDGKVSGLSSSGRTKELGDQRGLGHLMAGGRKTRRRSVSKHPDTQRSGARILERTCLVRDHSRQAFARHSDATHALAPIRRGMGADMWRSCVKAEREVNAIRERACGTRSRRICPSGEHAAGVAVEEIVGGRT